jgi:hypothetical protein
MISARVIIIIIIIISSVAVEKDELWAYIGQVQI